MRKEKRTVALKASIFLLAIILMLLPATGLEAKENDNNEEATATTEIEEDETPLAPGTSGKVMTDLWGGLLLVMVVVMGGSSIYVERRRKKASFDDEEE